MCIKMMHNIITFIKNTFRYHGKCQQSKTSNYLCTNLDEKIRSKDEKVTNIEEMLTKEI